MNAIRNPGSETTSYECDQFTRFCFSPLSLSLTSECVCSIRVFDNLTLVTTLSLEEHNSNHVQKKEDHWRERESKKRRQQSNAVDQGQVFFFSLE